MAWVALWVFFSVGVSFLAGAFNRGRLSWFFISFVFSPIIGGTLLLIMGNDGKKCPKCAETIKPEAIVCKHCSYAFEPAIVEKKEVATKEFSGWDR